MRGRDLEEFVAALLHERTAPETLLERFCASCLEELAVTGAALVMIGGPEQHLVVTSTDPLAGRLAELEFALGEGPGVEAERSGGPVLVADLQDVQRTASWPLYGSAAAEASARAQFSFPLTIGAIRLGVLTLYYDRPGTLSTATLADALVFAEAATVLLLHLQDVSGDGVGLPADLDSPFASTAALHQATGMVSVQADVGMSEALLLLRSRAFGSGRTPLELAHDVVEGSLHFRQQRGHDGG